jgi:membrane-bound ClpP family serine protease
MLMMLVGVVLLVVEMYIPGFGAPGISGIALLVLGFVLLKPPLAEGLILFAILAAIATLAVYLEQKTRIGSKVTGCVMALIFAMVLSNTGIIPLESAAYDFVWSYIIPLAIPMLLFNADIKRIGRES